MSRMLIKGAGIGLGLAALAACDPSPPRAEISITISNPAPDSNPSLSFSTDVTITGDFKLEAGGCDPKNVSVSPETGLLTPGWDPYACSDENGDAAAGIGNIQFFVDGIFHAFSTTNTIQIDLTPKLSFAYYDVADLDGDEAPDDLDGDGEPEVFFYCNFYYPDDNLGYASTVYDAYKYTLPDVGGPPVYDAGTGLPMATQPIIYDSVFDMAATGAPWVLFDYNGTNYNYYPDDGVTASSDHIFYAELHYQNFTPVYGVNRPRIITKSFPNEPFDITGMPADWCGGNVFFL